MNCFFTKKDKEITNIISQPSTSNIKVVDEAWMYNGGIDSLEIMDDPDFK